MTRIVSIVRDLRTFSRSERDHIEEVDMNEVVRVACRMVEKEIRYRARLVVEGSALPCLPGDRGKLTQVLVNLMVNAGQAIAEGAPEKNEVRVTTTGDAGELVVVVQDTGAGMPPEVQRRVFEPFFTTKQREHGTGLGLSLSADIVRQHGGSLTFTSKVGEGTRFEVRLPVRKDWGGAAPGPAPRTANPVARELPTLLVVDDEPSLLAAYRRTLARRFQLTLAGGGAEGLKYLEQGTYDAVLCDVMMPDMDGPTLYQVIREHHPMLAARFIFCSGGAFTPRTKDFLATLGNTVLEKPLDLGKLEAAVRVLTAG